MLVLDAARRDALEPYGGPAGSTPAIAQLARRGVALPDVYATGCWTIPSHASMFTGLMPRAAGLAQVDTPTAPKPRLEAHRERLLPEVMRRAGYRTAGFSSNLWLSRASGFDLGFDEFTSLDTGRGVQMHVSSARARLRWLAEAARGAVDDGAAAVQRSLDEQIDSSPAQPFFWFVNLIECHSPYLPPRRRRDGVSLIDRLRTAEDARRYYTFEGIWRACLGGFDVPPEALERLRRMYRASIAYMDDWLGRLLDRLDGAGLLDDTLVVVVSDHGENFGEGGLLAHAFSLDNRLIHVPFIAAGPGADAASLTSLADLPRFIAEAAGIEDHPWTDGPPPGVGVAQFDPAADPADERVIAAVERWGLGEEALRRIATPLTCAVSDGLKVVMRGEREEIYALDTDPLETTPLAVTDLDARRTQELTKLRAALTHPAMSSAEPGAGRANGDAGQTENPAGSSAEELADIEERMRLLGYM